MQLEPQSISVNPGGRTPDLRRIDYQICAILAFDGRGTPRYLSQQLDAQQSYVSQRLAELIDQDLVAKVDRGLYEIDCEVVTDE